MQNALHVEKRKEMVHRHEPLKIHFKCSDNLLSNIINQSLAKKNTTNKCYIRKLEKLKFVVNTG